MDSSMSLLSFVARAENRITVLLALGDGPQTRAALQDETGIPRATLSRILADFRDRDLVTREGHEYRPTQLGRILASELASAQHAIDTARAVQTLSSHLPLDDLDLDVTALAGADVTLPTTFDPMAPVTHAAEAVEHTTHVRTFCYSVVHAPILAALNAVGGSGQRVEGVVAAGVLDVVGEDPELAAAARDLFESGAVDVYLHEGAIEPQLIVVDDRTMFLVTDDNGAIQGLVDTTDDAIRAWAVDYFDALKQSATPLTPEAARARLSS